MSISPQSGFPFPVFKQGKQGRLSYVHNNSQALITSSVLQILLTIPGERLWNPTFGCRIQLLQFDTYSNSLAAIIQNLVLEALNLWEPRIVIRASDIVVSASTDIGRTVQILVKFKIKNPDFAMDPTVSIVVTL